MLLWGPRQVNQSMQVNHEDYVRHFSELGDEALLEVKRDDLVEAARSCYDEEVTRRGISAAPKGEAAPGDVAVEASHEVPAMVVAGEYQDPGEADLARALLTSAGIEAMLLNERLAGMLNIPLAPGTYHLLVPVESEEEALQILDSEISEEELATQAVAAGEPEKDDEN